MTPTAAFYHVWADGLWQRPLSEFLFALQQAEFPGPLTFGLVGSPESRELPRRIIEAVHPGAEFVEADEGFEQVTLRALHAYSRGHEHHLLYAHTKGAAHPNDLQARWRQSMTARVLGQWRRLAVVLDGPWVDACGCHWQIPEECGSAYMPACPIFTGNFWMARAEFVRGLPDMGEGRLDAEQWIGRGRPSVLDLLPGVPSPGICVPPSQVGVLQVHVDGVLQPVLEGA